MMIRRSVFVLLAWLMCSFAAAQSPVIENLISVLGQTTDERTKCDILHQLAMESWDYSFETGLQYAKQGYTLARSLNYAPGLTQSLTDIGSYYFYKGDYTLSMNYYRQALRASPENEAYPVYLTETYMRMANLHRVQATFDSSEFYFKKAETCLKGEPDRAARSSLFHNRGLVRYELSDYTGAKRYFQKSLAIRLAIRDSMLIGESWKTLGLVYIGLEKYDSAVYFLTKIRDLAIRHHNPELLIFSHIHQGELDFKRGEFLSSMHHFKQALDSLDNHPFRRYQAIVLKNIGQVFEWQGDYENALEFFFKSLKLEEPTNTRQGMARTYDMMGWAYANQRDFPKALERVNACRRIFSQIKDSVGMGDYFILRGFIAQGQKSYQEALLYYDSCIAVRSTHHLLADLTNALNYKSQVLIIQKRFSEAMHYEERIMEIAKQRNDHYGLANYYNNMSKIMLLMGDMNEAERLSLMALSDSEKIKAAPITRSAYLNLTTIYKATGRFEKASGYYDRYIHLTDSLYTVTGFTRQAQLNALYELERREQEINHLHERSLLQQASLEAQQNQLRFQNTVLVLAILGCILLASLAYTLYTYSRSKGKANTELNRLNREITEQKEEIQAQSEELTEANQSLTRLNYDLVEKTEEIQAQSEELRETNEMIIEINRDLDNIVTKRTAQLKEAYKELDTFFYRSSHDFRRPLTTFMGLAEVAKVTVKDNNALELFEKVKETAKSLDKMLVKLQSISDVGAQQLVFKEVLLKEIFMSVCSGFHEELEQKGFKTSCEIHLPDSFVSYPAMIKIILENVIENAIQFGTPFKPYLSLKAYQVGKQCVMEIEDNGSGVPKEFEEKIFEMYFRGSDRSKGNGLGLYIVKKAVEKLNGSIVLDTTFKEGSRFIITLPMDDSEMSRW